LKWSKLSRLRRKELNAMRGMGDIPWPARRFRIAPTFSRLTTTVRCKRIVGTIPRRRPGWRGAVDLALFRKPLLQPVACGMNLELVPFEGRLRCPSCAKNEKRGRRSSRRRVRIGARA
jgi:hypothetical protein